MSSPKRPSFGLIAVALLAASALSAGPLLAAGPSTIPLASLPEALKSQWEGVRDEMTANSRCAAAFDSHSDTSKMTMKCSIHIRMGSEGARRALRYCEEARETQEIRAACRLVAP